MRRLSGPARRATGTGFPLLLAHLHDTAQVETLSGCLDGQRGRLLFARCQRN
ncbi:hypothetical protein ACW9KT_20465 [Hymenobacter sp. HD11105]